MEEIVHAFGIDGRLIVIQIVNFGILVGVLWYFLYTPILKLLSDREAKIKQGIDDAEKASSALKIADSEKNEILKVAHGEAKSIVTRAEKHAEEKGRSLIDEAQNKITRDIENAKKLGDEIKANALKESESEIIKMSLLGAEKILNEKLNK
jgi:F-type H+-transporting ATPase subunit b